MANGIVVRRSQGGISGACPACATACLSALMFLYNNFCTHHREEAEDDLYEPKAGILGAVQTTL